MSFVKDFQLEKQKIKNIVNNLHYQKILDEGRYREIVEDLNNEKIKIAVIGQMKYGKSTFINSFIFHSNYLPTSSTPMTAALSEIKYSENEKYVVHFFREEEFELLKKQEEFKDILQKTNNIPNRYELFGTTKTISRSEFENYVGVDGLYTPIVKMLTIYSPNEVLKEAIVVDTPGFNDPIESREKIAEGFIKNADFIILFLYAERPFDATDRQIITEKLQYLGKAGKVLIVLNQADKLLDKYPTMDAINDYLQETLNNTIEDFIHSEFLADTLRKAEIIPISSLMALLARISEEELRRDKILSDYLKKFKDDFGIRDRKKLEKLSNISKLEKAIKKSLKEEKLNILINGIKQKIVGSISAKMQEIESELQKIKLDDKINSLEEVQNYKRKLEEFKNSDYKDEILPILSNAEIELKAKVGDEIADLRLFIDKEISEIRNSVRIANVSKDDMKYMFSNGMTQVNIEFKGKLQKLITHLLNAYRAKVYESINQIFSKLRGNEFAKEFELSNAFVEDLKSNLLNITLDELSKSLNNIQENIPYVDTSWWIFGDSIDEIKNKFLKALDDYSNKVNRELDEKKRQFNEIIEKAFNKSEERGTIIREFNKAVINPIDKALKEKEYELQGYKSMIEKDKNKLKDLSNKLNQLKEVKEFVEKELR